MRLSRFCSVALLALASAAEAQELPVPGDCAGLPANSFEAAILNCDGVTADAAEGESADEPLRELPLPQGEPNAEFDREAAESAVRPVARPDTHLMVPMDLEVLGEPPRPRGQASGLKPYIGTDGGDGQTDELWLEGALVDEPADPALVERSDEDPSPDLPPPAEGMPYAAINGEIMMVINEEIVVLDPESDEVQQLIRRGVLMETDAESYELLQLIRHLGGVAELNIREGNSRRGDEGDGQAFQIPNEQRPPPGLCRVWFPDRPEGHQPPPTSCDVKVPEGAVLIRG